jgi:hypothetical protein
VNGSLVKMNLRVICLRIIIRVAENCKFRDNFQELQQQEGNHRDAKQMFIRGWMQTINLTIGCIVLGVIIYRQTRQK